MRWNATGRPSESVYFPVESVKRGEKEVLAQPSVALLSTEEKQGINEGRTWKGMERGVFKG
jgi:hypothetical protein